MMVLHLDPVNHTASILSIPRDLFSPMPANSPVGSYQKMDAALNDGSERAGQPRPGDRGRPRYPHQPFH